MEEELRYANESYRGYESYDEWWNANRTEYCQTEVYPIFISGKEYATSIQCCLPSPISKFIYWSFVVDALINPFVTGNQCVVKDLNLLITSPT